MEKGQNQDALPDTAAAAINPDMQADCPEEAQEWDGAAAEAAEEDSQAEAAVSDCAARAEAGDQDMAIVHIMHPTLLTSLYPIRNSNSSSSNSRPTC